MAAFVLESDLNLSWENTLSGCLPQAGRPALLRLLSSWGDQNATGAAIVPPLLPHYHTNHHPEREGASCESPRKTSPNLRCTDGDLCPHS